MKFCSECGTAVGSNIRFCGECGTQVRVATPSSAQPQGSFDDVIDVSPKQQDSAYSEPPFPRFETKPPPAAAPIKSNTSDAPAINLLDIRKLSFGEKAMICWGFMWRGVIVSLGSLLATGLIGGLIENSYSSSALIIAGVLMAAVGCYCLYLWIMWALSTTIGNFKLLLVRNAELGS